MNAFDVVVAAAAVVAIVLGFSAGLLRSLATILGYLVAAPLAVAITPYVTAIALSRSMSPPRTPNPSAVSDDSPATMCMRA